MTQQEAPALPTSSPESSDAPQSGCSYRSRHGFVAGLVLGVIGAGLVGFAIGATMPVAEAALSAMSRVADGPPTIDDARDHAEFFAAFALHRLDATREQEENVQKIVGNTVDNLFPIVEKHRANRDQLHTLLEAPVIDRAALERLRVEEVALADSLSRVVATSVADAAEALTTEQRAELLEHLQRFRHRH